MFVSGPVATIVTSPGDERTSSQITFTDEC